MKVLSGEIVISLKRFFFLSNLKHMGLYPIFNNIVEVNDLFIFYYYYF